MNVMVIGATGMLGQAICRVAVARQFDCVGAARRGADVDLDILDTEAVTSVISDIAPSVVINAAAMTDHDACEREPDLAHAMNAAAVGTLAVACAGVAAKLVQVSTDQFYTGDGDAAHAEDAPITCVPSEYAKSKLAGEGEAQSAPGALVVRTNITGLRGLPARPTFIEWVFSHAEAGKPFQLFDDYFGSTIDTDSFAEAVFDLIAVEASGLYNVASSDVSSKQTFILDAVEELLGRSPEFTSVSVAGLTTKRAESAGLDVRKAEAKLARPLPGRGEVVKRLATAWKARGA